MGSLVASKNRIWVDKALDLRCQSIHRSTLPYQIEIRHHEHVNTLIENTIQREIQQKTYLIQINLRKKHFKGSAKNSGRKKATSTLSFNILTQ